MAELTLETFLKATAYQMAHGSAVAQGHTRGSIPDEKIAESADKIHAQLTLYARGDLNKPVDPNS